MYYLISNKDELYHHGILGMKWGVRRYQNKDGTLTEEGSRRYNKFKEKIGRVKDKTKILVSNYRVEKAVKTGNVSKLSEEELNRAIKRINLEKSFKDVYKDTKKISTGRKIVSEILSSGVKKLSDRATSELVNKIFEKSLSEYDTAKRDAEYAANKTKQIREKVNEEKAKKEYENILMKNREEERISKAQEKEYEKWLKEHSK